MAELAFKDLSFEKQDDKVKVNFLRIFYAYLDNESLSKIGSFDVNKNSITFKDISENNARKKLNSCFIMLSRA